MTLRRWISATLLFAAFGTGATGGCSDDGDAGTTGSGTGGSGSGGSGSGGSAGNDGGVAIGGLSGAVDATYDENGILHLACTSDDDCFAALGYFHAQNRFFFMDFIRNLVRGKLGSLVKAGDVVLERDYTNRQFFATPDGTPLEEKLYANASPETRGHLDAYTRGVNAWIGDMKAGKHGATLTTEYDFALVVKSAIRDWEPVDSAAVGLYVLQDLSDNSGDELALGISEAAYDGPIAADLFSGRPLYDAFTKPLVQNGKAPKSGSASSLPDWLAPRKTNVSPVIRLAPYAKLFATAAEKLRAVGAGSHGELPGDIGSNNWAVGPSRTTSKHAIVANDPHLPLSNPSIWFPVELDAKSKGNGKFHVAGSTFPGLPAVMIGHNEKVGWGVTTAYWDLADVYQETLTADGKAVLFKGKEVPIVEKSFEFVDASKQTTVTKTFRWVPHHGPLVSEDTKAHTGVSVRWVGHEGGTDLDGFYGVATAASVEEARTAIDAISSANQNFVVVDTEGHMGWFPLVNLPKRPFASEQLPPWLPLPGDGTAEWDGYLPKASLPQLYDPQDGQIATANQDMTGASADGNPLNDGQDALQAFLKADGTRQRRILDMLTDGGTSHSIDTLRAMQFDSRLLIGQFVATAIAEAADGATLTSKEKAVLDALAAWSGTCPTGLDGSDPVKSALDADPLATTASIGCTAAHAVIFAVVHEAFADEIKAAGDVSPLGLDLGLVLRALKDPTSLASGVTLWDDVATKDKVESKTDILLRGLSLAANGLDGLGKPSSWQWGRVHTISLRSIFDNFGIATYNDGPYAASGGLFTVNVASPRQRALAPFMGATPFEFSSGPSIRFVVEAKPEGPRMIFQLPGGSDLHRDSPFYNNLLPKWLKGEPVEFPFGPGAVTKPALVVHVEPAN